MNSNSIDEILEKIATEQNDPDVKTTTTIFAMALLDTRKDVREMKTKINKVQNWLYYLFFTILSTLISSLIINYLR